VKPITPDPDISSPALPPGSPRRQGSVPGGIEIIRDKSYNEIRSRKYPVFLYQIQERIITMSITNHKAVTVQYTLKDDAGETIDTSVGRDPLFYIHGTGGLLPGFEAALDGKTKGDTVSFSLEPKDGYGERKPSMIFKVPRERFSDIEDMREGLQFAVNGPQGTMVMTALKIDDKNVTLDGNHPLAGKNLHFEVEVLDVRDATEEEIRESLADTGCGCSEPGHDHPGGGCSGCSEC
jgi:FKBP-type peptidyl-prolyl cis-trans isomerase SlyD